MRYTYYDLGRQRAGTKVTAQLRGSVCNLLLVDEENFGRYRAGEPFLYEGGLRQSTPVSLKVPEDGHWYAVIDLGGFKGRVRATIELETPDGSEPETPPKRLVLN